MLRNLRPRRRPRYGVFVSVVLSFLVLLLWLPLLHRHAADYSSSDDIYDSLLSDSAGDDFFAGDDTVDTIDALDVVEDLPLDAVDAEDEEDSLDQDAASSGYFFHHAEGVIRRAFISKSSVEEEEEGPFGAAAKEERSRTAFGSDDVAVEERVRSKTIEVKSVEDALLLKMAMGRRVSPLREGWGDWFDKKGDFLRKDKMLRSNLEGLNPLHNPILQDPDTVGLTGITKADKTVRNSLLRDLRTLPFSSRKIPHHHHS
ncbi:hypothetical protein Fmac_022599 [Flemingia macrophylla]|uniref:Uncharacterized protein n=1 Tax=Flemingia macrophylla TaxID=520843 RepID=A0ABD1M062_9FABA